MAAMTIFGKSLDEREDELPALGRLLAGDRRLLRQLVDVGAGHERLVASAGEDDRLHGLVITSRSEDVIDLLDRRRVQRVEHFRPIDRQDQQAIA